MEYELENLKLLAQGGEADIYDVDEDKILRVLRRQAGKTFETEQKLFPILEANKVMTPIIYEYMEVDDRPAELMQKITGVTMLQYMNQHPLKIVIEIKRFAGMHFQILNIDTDCDIHSIDSIVKYFVLQPAPLEKSLIDFAVKIFEELPKTNNICHGDFHPGNILKQEDKDYIIDWSGAYRSSFLSDIAHTYLLMSHAPEIPGQKHIQHAIISFIGSFIAKVYLKQILKLMNFDLADFLKWTVVMSLLRIYYGLPSERFERIRYLQKCYSLNQKGVNAKSWYKYL